MDNQENTTQACGQGTIIGLQYWSDLHDPSRNIERNFDYTSTARSDMQPLVTQSIINWPRENYTSYIANTNKLGNQHIHFVYTGMDVGSRMVSTTFSTTYQDLPAYLLRILTTGLR